MKSWLDAPRKKITPNDDTTLVSFVSDETAFQATGGVSTKATLNAYGSDCCLEASKKIAEACCLLVLVDGTEDMVKHLRLIAAVADEMGRP